MIVAAARPLVGVSNRRKTFRGEATRLPGRDIAIFH
jgi:hypothetical protein